MRPSLNRVLRRWLIGLVLAVGWVLLLFGEVLLRGRLYYGGDLARIYLPFRAALCRALARGRLPWWTPELGIGYPLLAEGEVGALYPPNWLACALGPAELSLTVSIVTHYALLGLGFYLWARSLGLSRSAAALGALVVTGGGFAVAHLGHVSMLSVLAWLPWMLWLGQRLLAGGQRAGLLGLALAAVVALQFLAGHAQISLLGLMLVGVHALKTALTQRRWRRLGGWALALALGMLISAPQLLASFQLGQLSQRAGGLDPVFFTSYSFHPLLAATLLSPFVLGNPYPTGSVELMAYCGLLSVFLGWLGLWRSRQRDRWFHAALAAAGLLLALGRWNPAYELLRHVPVLNLFRVPARYLLWTTFELALLAGYGLDALMAAGARPAVVRPHLRVNAVTAGVGTIALALAGLTVWRSADADALVAAWRWLPLGWLVGCLALLWAAGRAPRKLWMLAALALLAADLGAYGAVLDRTYNVSIPRQELAQPPRVLGPLRAAQRLYTKEEILPALEVMEESLYPDLALRQGVASANLYAPLVPRNYGDYIAGLRAERLNRLGVTHYAIPQLLPVDAERELYDVQDPLGAVPYDTWLSLEPGAVARVEVESYLSHAADLADGALAAHLWLRTAEGRELSFPLRAGLETAEWAYERPDVAAQVVHGLPAIASTWPASSGFPPVEHAGHTYLARWELAGERIVAARIEPVLNPAFVRVERVRLVAPDGAETLLSHASGQGDHAIVYRSEDVLLYRNLEALPRAYTLPADLVHVEGSAATLPERPISLKATPAEIVSDEGEHLVVHAGTDVASILVLADLAYPGWRVTVDGASAPLLTVDGVFRGVLLAPGAHVVEFQYVWWRLS